jgi:hypothetical protein
VGPNQLDDQSLIKSIHLAWNRTKITHTQNGRLAIRPQNVLYPKGIEPLSTRPKRVILSIRRQISCYSTIVHPSWALYPLPRNHPLDDRYQKKPDSNQYREALEACSITINLFFWAFDPERDRYLLVNSRFPYYYYVSTYPQFLWSHGVST